MTVKRQQGSGDQMDFFDEALKAQLCHGISSKGGTGAGTREEPQAVTAWERNRSLTQHLMEKVTSSANLNQAYKRVKANGGAPGVDGMTVAAMRPWIAGNRERLIASLLDGSYRPKPVRGVEIPKPGGGVRQLGIPTVIDRLVQQAIAQVLEPILDPTFSASSFGFRPRRGAHDALRQARKYVADGDETVVDLDLEKFFDRVNHDILMARLVRHIGDKCLLRIVRRFLQAGMMADGVCIERHEGTPQGGPLSPLLANLLLDDLDKELERRLPRTAFRDNFTAYETRKRGVEVFLLRTDEVRREIMRAPAHNAVTLCANSRGEPWTEDGLRTNFTKLRARLEREGRIDSGLTIHGLRHTVASELAECGVTDAEIACWLGQKTTAMARHYSERADKKKRMENVVVKLRNRGKL